MPSWGLLWWNLQSSSDSIAVTWTVYLAAVETLQGIASLKVAVFKSWYIFFPTILPLKMASSARSYGITHVSCSPSHTTNVSFFSLFSVLEWWHQTPRWHQQLWGSCRSLQQWDLGHSVRWPLGHQWCQCGLQTAGIQRHWWVLSMLDREGGSHVTKECRIGMVMVLRVKKNQMIRIDKILHLSLEVPDIHELWS